jgi:hypothetical protein
MEGVVSYEQSSADNDNQELDSWVPCEAPEGSFRSSGVNRDLSVWGFTPWLSLSIGLVLSTTAVVLYSVLGLQQYLPAVLLGIASGSLLWDAARLVVAHFGCSLFLTPAARRRAEALRFLAPARPPEPRR